MKITKDNQRAITFMFLIFVIGIIIGYNLNGLKTDAIHNNDLEVIKNMELRNAVLQSKVAKNNSAVDSIIGHADSVSRLKEVQYIRLQSNYKNYINEVKRNRKMASTIPAAQYVIDSILQSNGIRN